MTPKVSPRTVIEALLPAAGAVALSVVYDTANLAGIADQPLRLALRRAIGAGQITQTGRGRSGQISLTAEGHLALERDRQALRLLSAQDAGVAPWNGEWHLYSLSAPERERAVRDAFRREMRSLGAVTCATGLYVTPHDLDELLSPATEPYVVAATAHMFVVRGLRDPRAIAAELWPAADTMPAYVTLAQEVELLRQEPNLTLRRLYLADALERAVREDPLIPAELRTEAWSPVEIRRAWRECWNAAGDAASDAGPELFAGWDLDDPAAQ